MHALALIPGTKSVRMVDRSEPQITAPDEIKLRVLQGGICGIDREEAAGGRASAPPGQTDLVIGHEVFGQVVAVGPSVTRVTVGDYAVFTVRRSCGACMPCAMYRSDMCRTGNYRERGIWGLDGYQAAYVVDQERYVVRVPPDVAPIGVLTEPLAVAEKAIGEAVRLQLARLPDAPATPNWLFGRRCLVAGMGPIGLLAAMVLRLRGAVVYGLGVVNPDTARPQWLAGIGGQYIDGRRVSPVRVRDAIEPVDLIFESTGVAALQFNLLDALARDGVYVLTGIPGGDRALQIAGAELVRQLVQDNQVMVGSVTAARDHFQLAVDDLTQAQARWGEHLGRLITGRYPAADFAAALAPQREDRIKIVLEW
jgi:threonine dehydrogenase-like Zn-dependent dehydrogenase